MPETYGLPEPESTRIEAAQRVVNEAVAGQGLVRRVILYVAIAVLIITPVPTLAMVPLLLLMATDGGLA